MFAEYAKAIGAYALTLALGHVAARYHLTGDQVNAVMADVASAATFIYGVWAHGQAAKMEPPK